MERRERAEDGMGEQNKSEAEAEAEAKVEAAKK
jgi:hypothetical protein